MLDTGKILPKHKYQPQTSMSLEVPQPARKCSCGGTLVITGEIREGQWRTGFQLTCKQCGKRWKYAGGFYTTDEEH